MHIGDSLVPTTSDWRFLPTICARDYTCISTKLFGCCAVKNLPAFARCLIHSPTPRQFPDIFQPDYRLWTHALRSSRGTPGLLIFVLSLLFQRDHRLWPSTDGFLHSANRRFDLNGANSFPAGMVFFAVPFILQFRVLRRQIVKRAGFSVFAEGTGLDHRMPCGMIQRALP